ncbi:hypothetical protein BOX15_Mlig025678g2 [Macrostomum lignano]|uniref:Cadherin domain-containing protein n=1 Tax=Macrostomum lignano TaxID=282301 RepID=A0A267H9Z6_9PLAT|nr:hypothetical protein BOX15_Mlig025678g2 [Macrostomum lignano]
MKGLRMLHLVGAFIFVASLRFAVASETRLSDNINFNSKVASLTALSRDFPPPPAGDPSGYYRVSLRPYQTQLEGFFVVDRLGTISSNRDIDRDEICSKLDCCGSLECRMEFIASVTVRPADSARTLTFQLVLIDENDEAPSFPNSGPIDIREDAVVGSDNVKLPAAVDKDSPAFSVKAYNLTDPTGTFAVVLKSGVPHIKLLRPLDRETEPQYQVTLRANDGEHEGSVVITVRVGDVNDNPPIFDQGTFVKSEFPENRRVNNDPISPLTASDKDAGRNAKVIYRIAAVDPPTLNSFFDVRIENGFWGLFLNQSLDYEVPQQRTAKVFIEARDQGSPPQSSTCTVSISVTDINDNEPVIKELANYQLDEHRPPEVLVKAIQVTDADAVSIGKVQCMLESNPKFKLERNTISSPTDTVEQATYNMYSTTTFDYEVAQEEKVDIKCLDNASPVRTTRQSFIIPIRETNDDPPKFISKSYFKQVDEDLSVNRQALKVSATDRDKGFYGEIEYLLDEIGQRNFTIDSEGSIKVKVPLDRETAKNLRFNVIARDRGNLSDTATVVIELLDVNDNDPYYTGPLIASVQENSPPGTPVAQVSFADPDLGENGTVDFDLSSSEEHRPVNEYFSLHRNGTLTVRKPIDRETWSSMPVALTAWDMGLRRRSSTAVLTVNIGDVNDCPPTVVKPRPGALLGIGNVFYTNVPRKTLLITVEAEDKDAGENRTVDYRLLASNASSLFDIDRQSGEIHSVWRPEEAPPTPGLYYLTVQVTDQGSRVRLSSETTFYVRLTAPPEAHFASAGISGLIILILIIAGTVVIAVGLIVAICYVRGRADSPDDLGAGVAEAGASDLAEARLKMRANAEDFHGYHRESPVPPYDARLLHQQQHQCQHQLQHLLQHQHQPPHGSLKRHQQDYYAWSRPGSPLTMMSLQQQQQQQHGDDIKQHLYRPYPEMSQHHRSDYLPMEHVTLTCGRGGIGGHNTFMRGPAVQTPMKMTCQTSPRIHMQTSSSLGGGASSGGGGGSEVTAITTTGGSSIAGGGATLCLHERRHSEEDASVDDSGRGGSMEDLRQQKQQQQQQQQHAVFKPKPAASAVGGTMI